METPNGNPIASILPGLPTLQHGDSVIVMFRSGVDPNQVRDILNDKFYPLNDGETEPNFVVGNSMFSGKLPAIASVVHSLSGMRDHPGVVSPQHQNNAALTPVPKDGYMPFIALTIMPYQQSRMSTLEVYTNNLYAVTAGVDNLLFERLQDNTTAPKTVSVHKEAEVAEPLTVDACSLDVGPLNPFLGNGAARGKTSLWLAKAHDYKTGHLVDMLWRAMTRNPAPNGRRRTAIFVSSENQPDALMAVFYQRLRARVDGRMETTPTTDATGLSSQVLEHRAYVTEHLAGLGWEYIFYQTGPGLFDILEFRALLNSLSAADIPLVVVDDLTVSAFKGNAVDMLRQINGLRVQFDFHLAVADNLPVSKIEDTKLTRRERLTLTAVEGCYNKELAKLADHTCVLGVVDSHIPRVMYQPAGFDSGKPSFDVTIMSIVQELMR